MYFILIFGNKRARIVVKLTKKPLISKKILVRTRILYGFKLTQSPMKTKKMYPKPSRICLKTTRTNTNTIVSHNKNFFRVK